MLMLMREDVMQKDSETRAQKSHQLKETAGSG
jgi:hypothetical protein